MKLTKLVRHAPAIALAGLAMIAADANAATRNYSICAVEKEWNYTGDNPLYATINHMTGEPYTEEALVFVGDPSETNIGRIYTKSRYVACDANGVELPRAAKDNHLGILGPVIRAEVGDTIVVKFKNLTRFPTSMHPHGVFYDKNSEGAPYGVIGPDDMVAAYGGTHTYTWGVPRRAGPGPKDPSSIAWLYHSHADEVGDTNAGLVGAIIITRDGEGKADGSPKGVDKEFVSFFTVMDENASVYLDANMATKLLPGGPDAETLKADGGFAESNLKHAVNGLLYGTNHDYEMKVGDKVRWYVLSLGTEVDIHTPHWHGVTLLHAGQRTDVAEVFPGSSKTYSLRADNPGHWMFHCHVNDHIIAGMHAMFTIKPGEKSFRDDDSDWE